MSDTLITEACTDEELIALSHAGREGAADLLLVRYKPLVLKLSRTRFLAGGDRDDLIQEGMIGLYKAIRDYDPERETKFMTFAALCIDRQILRAIEASQREKNRALNDSVLLGDGEIEAGLSEAQESPENIVLLRERTDERLARLRDVLSRLEKQVLALYLEGLDYREIAERLGRTPKQTDNALQRIRRKSQELS
ncbi:MAG: sigma-70 family RNA polymerase sigma factor [Lachnospiraceae bacterium]|nr:sigma-70 family RNA polymerase sigma factor [Lachnospiraceae bacterium]